MALAQLGEHWTANTHQLFADLQGIAWARFDPVIEFSWLVILPD